MTGHDGVLVVGAGPTGLALAPLGVTEGLLARADPSPRVCLHLGTRTAPVDLADLDLPDTAFPHLSLLLQAAVEAVLARALGVRGVRIERGTALVGVRNTWQRELWKGIR